MISPLTCFPQMIDCALSTSETFQSRSRKKLSPGSLVAMERFCPSVIASSMSTLMSAMVTGWPKYYWIMTFRSLLKSMDATVALGIHVNRLSVLYAESLAIVPRPAHSLLSPARPYGQGVHTGLGPSPFCAA